MKFWYIEDSYLTHLRKDSKNSFVMKPMSEYPIGTKPKFVFGVVITIDGFDYYIPVSSIKSSQVLQTDNNQLKQGYESFAIPIRVQKKNRNKTFISALLRVDFMFPVLNHIATLVPFNDIKITDNNYYKLLDLQFLDCKNNKIKITEMARDIYNQRQARYHHIKTQISTYKPYTLLSNNKVYCDCQNCK